jgi:SpoVK/Ycf46/Vps4 family AAA+-type ATPase
MRQKIELLEAKKQIILYGPPGTGKTYNTKSLAVRLLEGRPEEYVPKEKIKEIETGVPELDIKGMFKDWESYQGTNPNGTTVREYGKFVEILKNGRMVNFTNPEKHENALKFLKKLIGENKQVRCPVQVSSILNGIHKDYVDSPLFDGGPKWPKKNLYKHLRERGQFVNIKIDGGMVIFS